MANYIELETQDSLAYKFYPVASGSVTLKVRATNDAHIILAGSTDSDQVIEAILGGWRNTRSVIRRNRTKPDKAELDTPAILDGAEYRGFYIKWEGGVISVSNEGEDMPFLSWTDPEPFPIRYVGVCTAYGASGSWKIDDEEFATPDSLVYNFRPVNAGYVDFEYRGPHNCHLCLTTEPAESEPIYEVILGGWENSKSVIRHNLQKPGEVVIETPGLMDANEYKHFVVEWRNGKVSVVKSGEVVMEWKDPAPFPITHFGIRSPYGASGQWRIKHFAVVEPLSVVPLK